MNELMRLNIQMFAEEEVYAFCETGSKHPTYTKEQTNNLLKGKFAVVESSFTTESNNQYVAKTIEYPTGFTKENTWVLNRRYFEGTSYITYHVAQPEGGSAQEGLAVYLKDSHITLSGRLPFEEIGTEVKVQVLLMKVE